jgi:S-adenosylmethionine decarboxylase
MNRVGMLGHRSARSGVTFGVTALWGAFCGAGIRLVRSARRFLSLAASAVVTRPSVNGLTARLDESFRYEVTPRSLRQEDDRSLGTHLLVELYGCDTRPLERVEYVETAMVRSVQAANAHIVSHFFHEFEPYGVSGVVVIEESHFTIHTWPEHRYAAIDLFFCSTSVEPDNAMQILCEVFQPERVQVMKVQRGFFHPPG